MAARILSLLGFAQRAGKLVSGDAGVRAMLQKKRASLILIAADAADNTKEVFVRLSTQAKVEWREYATKDALGQAIGKPQRSVLAVVDAGFARTIREALEGEQTKVN